MTAFQKLLIIVHARACEEALRAALSCAAQGQTRLAASWYRVAKDQSRSAFKVARQ